jgi:eukaryotic-like serine/threonine-protein kinase
MKCPKCQTDNASDSRFCKECATALPATSQPGVMVTETLDTRPVELTTGSSFAGRYQIIEELGHGGMGRVFRALDTKLHEEVALKLIRPEIALDRNTLERFQNELKLARKISHRNVGRMYELMDDRGAHFITMEYVPGEDLRSFILRSGQLTVGKTLSIARQISEGLDEAHRQGIIHRDLKPSNIIIDREGNAKIMDFGIARSLTAKSKTGVGVMIGTPEYMSPEQVEGREVDARSDLYSLGIIIYEMLTGRVPFEGDTPFTIGIKQKSERPKDPRDFNASIPGDLNRLILKCLEKDKVARPQSVADIRAELARIEHGLPTTERVAPSRKPLTSREITVKFTPKKLALPVAVFVMIAAVVAWRILAPKRAAPLSGKPSLAIAYFENISGDPALDDWKMGVPELLTTDLAQSKFLTVLSGDTVYGILKKLGLLDAQKYSADDLVKVADEGRVHYVLTGGIMKAGPKIIITARLQKPRTGEVVETKKIECEGEEDIPRKVDELTRMIKADLDLTPQQIAGDIDKDVGRISTSSPEALKYYVEARKLHNEMKSDPAISLYERAIALDPGFAMAYRGMASCYSNKGFLQKAREFNQKAMDHADRISDRERLLIQGRAYDLSERTYGKAIQAYEELLKLYPDDSLGLNGLGVIYSAIEESEKALAYFERDYALNKDAMTCANVAGELKSLGRYDEARGVYEEYLRSVADNAGIRRGMGWNALAQGRYEEARREADKAFLISPNDIGTSNRPEGQSSTGLPVGE